MTTCSPFKYFKTSPEIIRLAVMYYIRYPLSFRQVKDILHERGVDICHETVRFWVECFGSKFAGEIRKNRAGAPLELAMAPGWSLCENKQWEILPLACRWSRRRSSWMLQKFSSYHAQIYNHFNHGRHLESWQTYKQKRSAALIEWFQICAL